MTKTLNSCSHSSRIKARVYAVTLLSAIVIVPNGDINTLLAKKNPWKAFGSKDAVLTSVRISREKVTSCKVWVNAFTKHDRSIQPVKLKSESDQSQWINWLPLEKQEIDAIDDCHEQPCAIKLDDAEVAQMAHASKENRVAQFLSIVWSRADRYQKTQVRSAYEYPGGISDPWSEMEKKGFKTDLVRPGEPNLGLRKLDLHNERVRPIRQLVDRRVAISTTHREASIWIRDVYTNHYFDSWGEWGNVNCDPTSHELTATLVISLEVDVLKNGGLFASISRGSTRNTIQQVMDNNLIEWWDQIQAAAKK